MTFTRSISLTACLLLVACNSDDDKPLFDGGSGDGDVGDGDVGDGDNGDGDGDVGDGDGDAGPGPGNTDGGNNGRDGGGGDGDDELNFNGFPVADHCAPGVYHQEYPVRCSGADETSALAAGLSDNTSVDVNVASIALPSPNSSGQPYALSLEIGGIDDDFADWQVEIWGSNSQCATGGGTADKLATLPLDKGTGVYCLEASSAKTYSHLLIAYRQRTEGDGFIRYGYTVCSAGTCPAP